MPDRLAIKRLTNSDLTFFEYLFRTLNVGNQKSINLNADVFIEELYPTLSALVAQGQIGDRIPVSLSILGPGGLPAHLIARSITKREAYKNWRLNGEFVRDPDDEPARYHNLQAGDLAVFDFHGDPSPQQMSLLLVSQSDPADAQLYAPLNGEIPGGRKTMVRVSRDQLAAAAAAVPKTHSIWQLASDPEYDSALEDAALGGDKGVEELKKTPAKVVSAATLAAAKATAEKSGRDGEALAWLYLKGKKTAGLLKSIEWTSQKNAVSAFDFEVVNDADVPVRIDAKSTSGEFKWPIHMSLSELRAAAEGTRYDIYRVYELGDYGASIKIASDIGAKAKAILAGLKLPEGVKVDGVSIDPKMFIWSEEEIINRPDEDEAGEEE